MSSYKCEVEGCEEDAKGRLCPEHAALKDECEREESCDPTYYPDDRGERGQGAPDEEED